MTSQHRAALTPGAFWIAGVRSHPRLQLKIKVSQRRTPSGLRGESQPRTLLYAGAPE